jgi:PAS domain S-box-containing protein
MSNEELIEKLKQAQKEKSYYEALSGQLMNENKRLEKMLDKYLRLFYDTPVGYITIDQSGIIHDSNRAFLRNINEMRDNVVGKGISDFIHEDSLPSYQLFFENVFLSGNSTQTDIKLVRSSGSAFDVRLTGNIEQAADGDNVFARITVEDISESKQREQQILDSEENYRLLIEYQDDYLLKIDTNGRILFASPSFCEIFDLDERQVIRKSILDFVSDITKEEINEYIRDLQSPPFRKNFDMRAATPRGQIYISWACKTVLDEDRRPVAVVGVGRDITGRKRAERKLRESEATARALINAPTDFVVLINRNGRLISGNTVAGEKFGLSQEEMAGNIFFELFDIEKRDFLFEMFDKVIKSGKSVRFENVFWNEWYDVVVYPVIDDGNVSKVAFVARDITNIKRDEEEMQKLFNEIALSEQKLTELNESKDKFFSIISHDLKSPLQSLLLVSKMLSRSSDELSREEIREYSEDLHNTSGNLYKLLENLLHWSRIQRGAIDYNPEEFDMNSLAAESIDIVQDAAARKDIQIENNISNDLHPVADINMTNTVIRNLLSNSIKFTGNGGRITIDAEAVNNEFIRIKISDTGVGMDRETVDSLFKIGRQKSSPGTKDEKGSGIGLILCRELVEKQGGSIGAESEPGKGSTFYFTLPYSE